MHYHLCLFDFIFHRLLGFWHYFSLQTYMPCVFFPAPKERNWYICPFFLFFLFFFFLICPLGLHLPFSVPSHMLLIQTNWSLCCFLVPFFFRLSQLQGSRWVFHKQVNWPNAFLVLFFSPLWEGKASVKALRKPVQHAFLPCVKHRAISTFRLTFSLSFFFFPWYFCTINFTTGLPLC